MKEQWKEKYFQGMGFTTFLKKIYSIKDHSKMAFLMEKENLMNQMLLTKWFMMVSGNKGKKMVKELIFILIMANILVNGKKIWEMAMENM